MKFLSIIILFILMNYINSYGQEYDRCWPLGTADWLYPNHQGNLVFTGNTIRIDTVYRNIKFGQSCGSISDSLGNLKYFGNGCVLGNSNNDTLYNGSDLNPGSCPATSCGIGGSATTQGNLFIPDPTDSNLFILFHEACDFAIDLSPTKLYMSKIDMSLDSGRGGVTIKNNILFLDSLCDGSLTAVKHADGRAWWVIVHEKYNNTFVRFLFDSLGYTGPFFQNIGPVFDNDQHGNSKFSPNGNWYATSTQEGGIDLYNFNRCTGMLSNRIYLDFPDSVWNNTIEFSLNSKFLYTTWLLSISQFDLTSTNIPASIQTVATYDGFMDNSVYTYFWMPQLAPNGKIYISVFPAATYMHVIDHPDSLGMACNVLQHTLHFPISNNRMVPNFPNYRLGPVDSTYCDSLSAVEDLHMNENAVLLFPNPASENVSIRCENRNEQVRDVFVFDCFGRVMNIRRESDEVIDVSQLSAGLYFLNVVTTKGKYVKKIMIE